jgi:hypothetical protein
VESLLYHFSLTQNYRRYRWASCAMCNSMTHPPHSRKIIQCSRWVEWTPLPAKLKAITANCNVTPTLRGLGVGGWGCNGTLNPPWRIGKGQRASAELSGEWQRMELSALSSQWLAIKLQRMRVEVEAGWQANRLEQLLVVSSRDLERHKG